MQETYNCTSKDFEDAMKSVSKKWRQFKTQMTRFIYEDVNNPEHYEKPPFNYRPDLYKKAWKIFVAGRTSKEWKVYFVLLLVILSLEIIIP